MFREKLFIILVFCWLSSAYGKASSRSNLAYDYGEPINILLQNEDSNYEIRSVAIDSLLLDPEVENREIVVISIAGAFRKGKSFFLNYCLRYLYANVG